MNILLYYPRLLTALLLQPPPRTLAALQHWTYAQIFLLWNEPWFDESESIGLQTVRIWRRQDTPCDPVDPTARRTSMWLRIGYLWLLFYWPVLSLLVAISCKKRILGHWNSMVNNMILLAELPDDYKLGEPRFSSLCLYVPMLYVAVKTGRRLPDRKDEIHDRCRKFGIPTPRVFTSADGPLPQGRYVVKPVDGYRARGVTFTSDPNPQLGDRRLVVQEFVRNCAELRQLWGTDTLGSLRFITLALEGRYEVACAVMRIPVGDSKVDNICCGNGCSVVDENGRLGTMSIRRQKAKDIVRHPTTGLTIAGVAIPQFDECVQMAILSHQKMMPHSPFLNTDIAVTETGPMLVETNNSPGLPQFIFNEALAAKFVAATYRAVVNASTHWRKTAPKKSGRQLATFEEDVSVCAQTGAVS